MCDPVWFPPLVPIWKPTHCYSGTVIILLSFPLRTSVLHLFLNFFFLHRQRLSTVFLTTFPLPSFPPSQGFPVLLPGKCWAFHGVQGTLVISLSHPVRITHVTLDHLPRYNSPTGRIDSALKDFEVYVSVSNTHMHFGILWLPFFNEYSLRTAPVYLGNFAKLIWPEPV